MALTHCESITDFAENDSKPVTVSGTTEIELYRSDLATPPDGTFSARFAGSITQDRNCTLTFTFYQSGGRQITRSFSLGWGDLSATLTIPDVERITVSAATANCSFRIEYWEFILHYCRCCG